MGEIPVGRYPFYIAIASSNTGIPEKIYVTDTHSDNVSVINASSDKVISTIPVGKLPFAIAASPSTDKIYVAIPNSYFISVIDTHSDKEISRIHTDPYRPIAIAASPSTDKIYVTDESDNVSVINASSDKVISTIPVGPFFPPVAYHIPPIIPVAIAFSRAYPSIIYVLNQPTHINLSKPITISVIDSSVDKVAAGITVNIHPANSGGVWCNNKEYPTNTYLYVASGTKCIARPAKGFEFSSWVENLKRNSTIPLNQSAASDSPWNSFLSTLGMKPNDPSATFDVNTFGTFTANFKPVPPSVPPEYWIPLYGIIVSTIVGWSIPSIIGWIKSKKQGSKLDHYHNEIKKVYDDAKIDRSDIQELNSLRDDITDEYTRGKINKESYDNLVDEISISYGEIITKEIDSLNKFYLSENEVKGLSAIIDDIEDMHAKGKINNDNYTNLKKQTSILYQEIFRRRIDSLKSLQENKGKLLDEIKEDISDAYSKEKISELHYTFKL